MTPDQLAAVELRTAVRGYHQGDVDELLDRVADELDALRRENAQLRAQVAALAAGGPSADAEGVLATAREEAAAIRDEAARVLAQAQASSAGGDGDVRSRRERLEQHVAALREFEASYRERLRAQIEEHLAVLDRHASADD